MPPKITMLPGARFGRLVILTEDPERTPEGRVRWICQCDCGTTRSVYGKYLRSGITTSCGCWKREVLLTARTSHGLAHRIPEYGVWLGMRARCLATTHHAYADYGGRGITIDPEWDAFERFLADMGAKPSPQHTLDRIDNDGPYARENCRWATRSEQALNRRRRRAQRRKTLTAMGETLSLIEWADRQGLPVSALRQRITGGWPAEQALTIPLRKTTRTQAR
jgi:hypothetical protein